MRASQRVLSAKRAARGAERIAAQNSREDHPWSLANVRVWQSVMCRALDEQHALIGAYLRARKVRG